MHHFFAKENQASADKKTLVLKGNDVNHIANVLRMRPGDEISVSFPEEGTDAEYRYGIDTISADAIHCSLRFIKTDGVELPVRVTLLQALPKGDKMDQIIQKCVELGVSDIIPVMTKRCVMRIDAKKIPARTQRWNKIAEAAAKQSRRAVLPKVSAPCTLPEALSAVKDADVKLLPYELAGESGMALTRSLLSDISAGQHVVCFIGPEGGFEEDEVAACVAEGFRVISLGRRILRTETAGMAVLSFLTYELEP